MSTSIEIVTFTLKEAITSKQLLVTNSAMQAFLMDQAGFLYRTLSYDEDQELWFDIIYWKNKDYATTGGKAFMDSAVCASMMSLIDNASCTIRHMEALSEISVNPEPV